MRVHTWLVLVSMVLAATASDAAPPEPAVDDARIDITARGKLPVLVYTVAAADLDAADRLSALEAAGQVLSTASVDVAWTVCAPGTCLSPSPALKVRIVLSPDDSGAASHVLGHAAIDVRTRTGVLATVFIDRTRRLAGELGIDHRVLLGRTIAHELGHLLLATTTHGSAGLMREAWSRDELLGTRRDDWIFDRSDAEAIRKRLARLRGAS
jgi:hypothetical protein